MTAKGKRQKPSNTKSDAILRHKAEVLAYAAFYGDAAALTNYGRQKRTLQVWRSEMDRNPVLRNRVKQIQNDWTHDIPNAIKTGVQFLLDTCKKMPPSATGIQTVLEVVQVLSEVQMTKDALDRRFGEMDEALPSETAETVLAHETREKEAELSKDEDETD